MENNVERELELDITNIKWDMSLKEFRKMYPALKVYNDNEIYFLVKMKEVKLGCTLIFSKFRKKLKMIEITIADIIKDATAGSEVDDFIKSFNTLKKLFGEPDVIEGIKNLSPEEIREGIINKENYPRIFWLINENMIVHTFQDYWGIIPYTYIVNSKKRKGQRKITERNKEGQA